MPGVDIRETLYGYRPGFFSRVPAQEAGEALRKQLEETGHLEPQETIRRAEPESAPTHEHFLWDNAKAANAYRLKQARDLISATRRIPIQVAERIENGEKVGPEEYEIVYVPAKIRGALTKDHKDQLYVATYTTVEMAVASPNNRYHVLDEALKMIEGLERRIRRVAASEVDRVFLLRLQDLIREEIQRRLEKEGNEDSED